MKECLIWIQYIQLSEHTFICYLEIGRNKYPLLQTRIVQDVIISLNPRVSALKLHSCKLRSSLPVSAHILHGHLAQWKLLWKIWSRHSLAKFEVGIFLICPPKMTILRGKGGPQSLFLRILIFLWIRTKCKIRNPS